LKITGAIVIENAVVVGKGISVFALGKIFFCVALVVTTFSFIVGRIIPS